MEELSNALVVVGLFVLRLGVPLLITLAIGYGLSRLDARWQAEAEAEARAAAEAARAKRAPRARQPRPGFVVRPTPQGPVVQPCWSVKGCSEAARAACAAFNQPQTPCWAARRQAEGRTPPECRECGLYRPGQPASPSLPADWH